MRLPRLYIVNSKLKTFKLSNVYSHVSKVTVQILLLIILNIKFNIIFVTFHFHITRQVIVFVRYNIRKSGVILPSWFHQCYGATKQWCAWRLVLSRNSGVYLIRESYWRFWTQESNVCQIISQVLPLKVTSIAKLS